VTCCCCCCCCRCSKDNAVGEDYHHGCITSNPFEQQNNNSNELSPQTSVAAPSERSYQTVVLKEGPVFIITPPRAQAEPTPSTQPAGGLFELFLLFLCVFEELVHHRGSYARSSTNKPAGCRRQEEKGNGHNGSERLASRTGAQHTCDLLLLLLLLSKQGCDGTSNHAAQTCCSLLCSRAAQKRYGETGLHGMCVQP
jgi:hypothetical protein